MRILAAIQRFIRADEGLETIEYAVMTALIVMTMIAAVTMLSTAVSHRLGKLQSDVSTLN